MSIPGRTDQNAALPFGGAEYSPPDVEEREWLQAERTRMLGRLQQRIVWLHVFGALSISFHYLAFDLNWRFGFMILMEAVNIVAASMVSRHYWHRGRNLASALVLMASLLAPALAASLLFTHLVIVFAFVSLLTAMLGGAFFPYRVAYRLAVGLAVASVLLSLLVTSDHFSSTLYQPPENVVAFVDLAVFLGALYLGTSLIVFGQEGTDHALEQLREANQQLEHEIREREKLGEYRVSLAIQKERMDMLASFMRDVSHEFRTPLSVINGQVYMLVRREAVAAEHMHRLQLIREESDYIDALVGALFEMVRLDTGIELTLADLNLNDVVRDVVEESGPSLLVKDLSLRLELADTLPPVEADRLQIRKALEKLVRNAVYFSPVGQEIVIRSAVIGGNAVISVVDSGPGIPPDVLPNIFERFYRGDRARTTKGAGLGLPIACKIMQMHAGCIDVETSVDNGSTFHMYFPLDGQKSLADSPPCAQ